MSAAPVDPHPASEELSLSIVLQIEDICLRLEKAWQTGEQPRIEDVLAEVPDAGRPHLLRQLLGREVHYRRKKGDNPALEDYLARFPQWAGVVKAVLGAGSPETLAMPGRDGDNTDLVCLGRFRIQGLLGKGGFGRVYRAHDPLLKRDVAIKVLHSRLVSDPVSFQAFVAEAGVLAKLKHPHIVQVHDAGRTQDGLCYIISEHITGANLAVRMQEARPSFAESARLVADIALALHHAHLHGLVHRDIKPANILIDDKSQPFVADFGLALRDEDFGHGPTLAGTLAYMSPEQARAESHRVDGRSDIFSLGVVFYELLTGKRPFRAQSDDELRDQISTVEARPPRQVDDAIPKELERIGLKALAKKASERYTTARDLAEDLQHWVSQLSVVSGQSSVAATDHGQRTTDSAQRLKIVPKGLRSFDAGDADFFVELLPGPRDRDGLPESLRFWKSRIERTEAEQTFAVGLIYGPSGCGKSSLVKAGLLPRLANSVTAVYVEAAALDTEGRLLNGLRRQLPGLPGDLGLVESLAALRRCQFLPAQHKVLLVLDQFEQWLHARRGQDNTELVQALRHCDGGRLQSIVMVRDDFWLAVSRFMADLDIELVQGENLALVDLFDPRHARKVLAAFGRAFAALPEDTEPGKQQDAFLDQAVAGLAQDGKVISVRLALFAEMVKGKPWLPATLKSVGGAEGVGVTFLEETFAAATAPPQHRLHQKAAQAVLKGLLPETGTDIKGHMRSHRELLEASGYAGRPDNFTQLLRILDADLRLITPTEPEEPRGDKQPCLSADPSTSKAACGYEKYYQLTHDYLVPSLREWLTRKQKETRRGRAELRLGERSATWNAKPQNRYLPAWWEWLNIRLFTRRRDWTASQQKMMRKARRYHGLRGLALVVLLVVIGWGSYQGFGTLKAHALRDRLLDANIGDVPAVVADMASYRPWLDPLLREAHAQAESSKDDRRQLHASLALLPVDAVQVKYLYGRLLDAEPQEAPVIRDALAPHQAELLDKLWTVAEQPAKGQESQRLRAASALASYAPEDPRWEKIKQPLAADLVAVPAVYLGAWMDSLRPVGSKLLDPLGSIFRDQERRETERSLATDILADYAADRPEIVARLLVDADPKQFAVLLGKLKLHENAGRNALDRELASQPPSAALEKPQKIVAIRKVDGTIAKDDDKVPISDGTQALALPAKVHDVKLQAGKKYTITMVSGELDAFLVLQDKGGKQLAFDDDGGGNLNAKLDFTPAKDDAYKVYAASFKGTGAYTLAIVDGVALERLAKESERLAKQQEQDKEALAKRQANAAVALLRLGQPDKVWPLFQHTTDPRRRSYLIRQLPLLGADPNQLSRRLFMEADVSSRRALLLALVEFGDRLSGAERASLAPKVLELYRNDPDPGIHGAADWLLRQWGQKEKLKETDKQLSANQKSKIKNQKPPGWYINGQGQTFAVMGPVKEFWMGSPPSEGGREGGPEGNMESRHKKRIARTFAIAAKEVTVEQFLRFRNSHVYNKIYAPKPDCPVNLITWYDASAYCNWLSEKEEIPADQWCYVKNAQGQFAQGMKAAPEYLKRTGYRLPTEAEWEYACRAGAATSRYFGETEELLPRYAWYSKNSLDRWMLPAGSLLPNDFGLLDMLGNALEWCHDPVLYYPTPKGENPFADVEYKEKEVLDKMSRVLRGGSFNYRPANVRSSNRNGNLPSVRINYVGFRAARTLTTE